MKNNPSNIFSNSNINNAITQYISNKKEYIKSNIQTELNTLTTEKKTWNNLLKEKGIVPDNPQIPIEEKNEFEKDIHTAFINEIEKNKQYKIKSNYKTSSKIPIISLMTHGAKDIKEEFLVPAQNTRTEYLGFWASHKDNIDKIIVKARQQVVEHYNQPQKENKASKYVDILKKVLNNQKIEFDKILVDIYLQYNHNENNIEGKTDIEFFREKGMSYAEIMSYKKKAIYHFYEYYADKGNINNYISEAISDFKGDKNIDNTSIEKKPSNKDLIGNITFDDTMRRSFYLKQHANEIISNSPTKDKKSKEQITTVASIKKNIINKKNRYYKALIDEFKTYREDSKTNDDSKYNKIPPYLLDPSNDFVMIGGVELFWEKSKKRNEYTGYTINSKDDSITLCTDDNQLSNPDLLECKTVKVKLKNHIDTPIVGERKILSSYQKDIYEKFSNNERNENYNIINQIDINWPPGYGKTTVFDFIKKYYSYNSIMFKNYNRSLLEFNLSNNDLDMIKTKLLKHCQNRDGTNEDITLDIVLDEESHMKYDIREFFHCTILDFLAAQGIKLRKINLFSVSATATMQHIKQRRNDPLYKEIIAQQETSYNTTLQFFDKETKYVDPSERVNGQLGNEENVLERICAGLGQIDNNYKEILNVNCLLANLSPTDLVTLLRDPKNIAYMWQWLPEKIRTGTVYFYLPAISDKQYNILQTVGGNNDFLSQDRIKVCVTSQNGKGEVPQLEVSKINDYDLEKHTPDRNVIKFPAPIGGDFGYYSRYNDKRIMILDYQDETILSSKAAQIIARDRLINLLDELTANDKNLTKIIINKNRTNTEKIINLIRQKIVNLNDIIPNKEKKGDQGKLFDRDDLEYLTDITNKLVYQTPEIRQNFLKSLKEYATAIILKIEQQRKNNHQNILDENGRFKFDQENKNIDLVHALNDEEKNGQFIKNIFVLSGGQEIQEINHEDFYKSCRKYILQNVKFNLEKKHRDKLTNKKIYVDLDDSNNTTHNVELDKFSGKLVSQQKEYEDLKLDLIKNKKEKKQIREKEYSQSLDHMAKKLAMINQITADKDNDLRIEDFIAEDNMIKVNLIKLLRIPNFLEIDPIYCKVANIEGNNIIEKLYSMISLCNQALENSEYNNIKGYHPDFQYFDYIKNSSDKVKQLVKESLQKEIATKITDISGDTDLYDVTGMIADINSNLKDLKDCDTKHQEIVERFGDHNQVREAFNNKFQYLLFMQYVENQNDKYLREDYKFNNTLYDNAGNNADELQSFVSEKSQIKSRESILLNIYKVLSNNDVKSLIQQLELYQIKEKTITSILNNVLDIEQSKGDINNKIQEITGFSKELYNLQQKVANIENIDQLNLDHEIQNCITRKNRMIEKYSTYLNQETIDLINKDIDSIKEHINNKINKETYLSATFKTTLEPINEKISELYKDYNSLNKALDSKLSTYLTNLNNDLSKIVPNSQQINDESDIENIKAQIHHFLTNNTNAKTQVEFKVNSFAVQIEDLSKQLSGITDALNKGDTSWISKIITPLNNRVVDLESQIKEQQDTISRLQNLIGENDLEFDTARSNVDQNIKLLKKPKDIQTRLKENEEELLSIKQMMNDTIDLPSDIVNRLTYLEQRNQHINTTIENKVTKQYEDTINQQQQKITALSEKVESFSQKLEQISNELGVGYIYEETNKNISKPRTTVSKLPLKQVTEEYKEQPKQSVRYYINEAQRDMSNMQKQMNDLTKQYKQEIDEQITSRGIDKRLNWLENNMVSLQNNVDSFEDDFRNIQLSYKNSVYQELKRIEGTINSKLQDNIVGSNELQQLNKELDALKKENKIINTINSQLSTKATKDDLSTHIKQSERKFGTLVQNKIDDLQNKFVQQEQLDEIHKSVNELRTLKNIVDSNKNNYELLNNKVTNLETSYQQKISGLITQESQRLQNQYLTFTNDINQKFSNLSGIDTQTFNKMNDNIAQFKKDAETILNINESLKTKVDATQLNQQIENSKNKLQELFNQNIGELKDAYVEKTEINSLKEQLKQQSETIKRLGQMIEGDNFEEGEYHSISDQEDHNNIINAKSKKIKSVENKPDLEQSKSQNMKDRLDNAEQKIKEISKKIDGKEFIEKSDLNKINSDLENVQNNIDSLVTQKVKVLECNLLLKQEKLENKFRDLSTKKADITQLEDIKNTIFDLKKEYNKITQLQEDLGQKANQRDVTNLTDRFDQYETRLQDLVDTRVKALIDDLRLKQDNLEQQFKTLSTIDLTQLSNDVQRINDIQNALDNKVDQTKLEELNVKFNQYENQLNNKIKDQVNLLGNELRNKYQTLENKFDDLSPKEIKSLSDKVNKFEIDLEKINELQQKLDLKENQNEINNLKDKIKDYTDDLGLVEGRIINIKQKVDQTLQNFHTRLQQQEKLGSNFKKLAEEFAQFKSDNVNHLKSLDTENTAFLKKLNDDFLEKEKTMYLTLQQRIDQVIVKKADQDCIKHLQTENEYWKNEIIHSVQQELDNINNNTDVGQLQKRIEELENKNILSSTEVGNLIGQYLTKEQLAKHQDIANLRAELDKLRDEYVRNSQVPEIQKHVKDQIDQEFDKKLKKYSKKRDGIIKDLRGEIDEIRDRHHDPGGSNDNYINDQIATLQYKLDQLEQTDHQQYRDELDKKYQDKHQELSDKIDEKLSHTHHQTNTIKPVIKESNASTQNNQDSDPEISTTTMTTGVLSTLCTIGFIYSFAADIALEYLILEGVSAGILGIAALGSLYYDYNKQNDQEEKQDKTEKTPEISALHTKHSWRDLHKQHHATESWQDHIEEQTETEESISQTRH